MAQGHGHAHEIREGLAKGAHVRAEALREAEEATARLRSLVISAASDGMPETQIADAAGVTRMTIRSWLGKR